MRRISGAIQSELSKDLAGNLSKTQYSMMMPTLGQMYRNDFMTQMMGAVNILLLVDMIMISVLVIYSLMLSDVQEQTYQFAMMRALGFQKDHVIVFVVLQAFSFSIPGVILGLIVACVINLGL